MPRGYWDWRDMNIPAHTLFHLFIPLVEMPDTEHVPMTLKQFDHAGDAATSRPALPNSGGITGITTDGNEPACKITSKP
jgi:hypothetical protein